MFVILFGNLLCIPLMFLCHRTLGPGRADFVVPGMQGGFTSMGVLLIVAIVGTTVTPWQLFFQQSNVVDKRITPRWIPYERADTVIGALVVVIGATAIMVPRRSRSNGTGRGTGSFVDARPRRNRHRARRPSGRRDLRHPAHRCIHRRSERGDALHFVRIRRYLRHQTLAAPSWREARPFYAIFTALVVLAAALALIPGRPLGLITTAVQALAGVLLPSASLFVLFLCNDRDVLGPWVKHVVQPARVADPWRAGDALGHPRGVDGLLVDRRPAAAGILTAVMVVGLSVSPCSPPGARAHAAGYVRPRRSRDLAHAVTGPAHSPGAVAQPA